MYRYYCIIISFPNIYVLLYSTLHYIKKWRNIHQFNINKSKQEIICTLHFLITINLKIQIILKLY